MNVRCERSPKITAIQNTTQLIQPRVLSQRAADSMASNTPAHIPTPPGTAFQQPPANRGTVFMGSVTVKIGGKAAARNGDPVKTCNDPADAPVGQIIAAGIVTIG